MDFIEEQYLRAISIAAARGDNDEAQYLAAGLREYRKYYKVS